VARADHARRVEPQRASQVPAQCAPRSRRRARPVVDRDPRARQARPRDRHPASRCTTGWPGRPTTAAENA
jgi:hypothetical protein